MRGTATAPPITGAPRGAHGGGTRRQGGRGGVGVVGAVRGGGKGGGRVRGWGEGSLVGERAMKVVSPGGRDQTQPAAEGIHMTPCVSANKRKY